MTQIGAVCDGECLSEKCRGSGSCEKERKERRRESMLVEELSWMMGRGGETTVARVEKKNGCTDRLHRRIPFSICCTM